MSLIRKMVLQLKLAIYEGVGWGAGGGGLGSDFHFYPHSTRAICEGQSTDHEHGKDCIINKKRHFGNLTFCHHLKIPTIINYKPLPLSGRFQQTTN